MKIFYIAFNTLIEILRQSFYTLILGIAAFFIALSPAFTMFTLMNSLKLLKDVGFATIMLAGLFITAISSSYSITRELESQTAITVLSKPISKIQFLLGKVIGLVVSNAIAIFLLTLILVMTTKLGVKDAAYIKLNTQVIYFEIGAFVGMLLFSFFLNYLFGFHFYPTFIFTSIPLFCIAFFLSAITDKGFHIVKFGKDIDWRIFLVSYEIFLMLSILTIVSLFLGLRFKIASTFIFIFIFFAIGLLSDFLFGRFKERYILSSIFYTLIPNFQFFWIVDAVSTTEIQIPLSYIFYTTLYAIIFCIVFFSITVFTFERMEITK